MLAETMFDSRDVGWRSLRVEMLRLRGHAEDVELPGIDAQLIDLPVRGEREVHSRRGERWTRGTVGVGMLSTTAPGNSSHLRWTSEGDRPVTQIRLLLPNSTIERAKEELRGGGSTVHPPLDALSFDDRFLRTTMTQLHRAARAGVSDLYAAAAAEFIAVHLLTNHGSAPAPRGALADDARIERVVEYLHAHLDAPVDLARLSVVAGLSPFHLLRLFRRHTGETPARYHRRLRLRAAERLLVTTDLAIAEIAGRFGYADQAHFAKSFRGWADASPSAYRAARRAG